MRRLTAFILLTVIASLPADSQQGNIWYFGYNAGLNFNNNPPTPLLDGQTRTDEGCSTVSDGLGNLLFYTDGITVWNKNHQPMPNGTGLLGASSSTHSAVVVPKPGSTSIYFIFTSDENDLIPGNNGGGDAGYNYSVLDMTLQGGLGDITSKNILLYAPSTEKLAAATHANGRDVWIITKEKDNDTFRSYLLTCNGLQAPAVVSVTAALSTNYTGYMFGCIKVSPDGTMIANARNNQGSWDLFHFNNATGVISDRLFISMRTGSGPCYGIEFSPDSKLLYCNTSNTYQYKVDVYDAFVIDNSRYLVTSIGSFTGALQTGPDMKIYSNTKPNLSVIANPNVYGPGCNYQPQSVSLGGRDGKYGFPTFLNQFITPLYTTDFSFAIQANCQSVNFSGVSTMPGPLVWEWDFGDGTTATGQNVNHIFPSTPNDFVVTLTVSNPNVCGFTTKMKRVVFDRIVPTANFQDGTYCGSLDINFQNLSSITSPGTIISYLWDFGDGNTSTQPNPSHTYASYGEYTVSLSAFSNDACSSISTKTNLIRVAAKPVVDFAVPDTCFNTALQFVNQTSIANGNIMTWDWDFGDGQHSSLQHPFHTYSTAGTYTVQLTATSDVNCVTSFSKTITAVAKPQPSFVLPDVCLLDGAAVFTNTTTIAGGSALSYIWDFGDPNATVVNPNSSTAFSPSHQYSMAANYMVKLVASIPGCRDSVTNIFTVNGAIPKAKFISQNIAPVCSNREVIIKDSSYVDFGRITKIEIEWGDGNTITDNDPGPLPNGHVYQHRYSLFSTPASQTYTITMRSYSGVLCVDVYQSPVTVYASPALRFDPISPVCSGSAAILIDAARETGGLPGSGYYSGTGIINGNGQFDPAIAGVGNHVITYSFTTDQGCRTDSAKIITVKPAPTIIATASNTNGARGETVQLQATGATTYTWTPSGGLNNAGIANPVATLSVSQLYTVAGEKDGCTGTGAVAIKVFDKAGIYVPTGFTPNGDGLNDYIKPVFAGIREMKYFRIYDRWGNIVFNSRHMNDRWEGNYKGTVAGTANFVWVAEAITFDDRVIVRKGNIVLIR
jgi:gliding motility-associated-like protein